MRILFLGDVVGKAGRLAVKQFLPELREERSPEVVIANGENIAGGIGMTSETLDELFCRRRAGGDVRQSRVAAQGNFFAA